MTSSPEHWNHIFSTTPDEELGWYEENAGVGLNLLQSVPGLEGSTVFVVGSGTSRLAEVLLKENCHITINDISQAAIDRLIVRLGSQASLVKYLCQDISHALAPELAKTRVWIDRAVLHFLQEDEEINAYFRNLSQLLEPGGYALFAEFSTEGANRCAGLNVHRYSANELKQRLGDEFKLLEEQKHIHITPKGSERPYVCALFQRSGKT